MHCDPIGQHYPLRPTLKGDIVTVTTHIVSVLGFPTLLSSAFSAEAFDVEALRANKRANWCTEWVFGWRCPEPRATMWDEVKAALRPRMTRVGSARLFQKGPMPIPVESLTASTSAITLTHRNGRIGQDTMDWTTCTSQIEKLELSPAQQANVNTLLSAAVTIPAPAELTLNPYDGGISLHWDNYELATFDDRYETYRFSEGETVIRHWPHSPGEPCNDAMISELMEATAYLKENVTN